jgi:hypothetical protein
VNYLEKTAVKNSLKINLTKAPQPNIFTTSCSAEELKLCSFKMRKLEGAIGMQLPTKSCYHGLFEN